MAELMERAISAHRYHSTPNTLSAIAALVKSSHQRRGLERGDTAGHARAGGRTRHALPRRARPPPPEELVPARALRPVRRVETGRRHAVRPLAPRSPQAWRRVHEDNAQSPGSYRYDTRVGRVDGHELPGQRSLRRPRRATTRTDGPGAERRPLRRPERMDATPDRRLRN